MAMPAAITGKAHIHTITSGETERLKSGGSETETLKSSGGETEKLKRGMKEAIGAALFDS